MRSALLVHLNGVGFSFHASRNSSIAVFSCSTLLCEPRLICLVVRMLNQPSTWLSQEEWVGMKWKWNLGLLANHRLMVGALCVA